MRAAALRALVAVLLPAALVALPALAAEEILQFDSRVDVQSNGDFNVEETIRVRAESNQIRRGIFRDFPTVRRLPSGLVQQYGFDVLAVLRDGRPEPHHTSRIEGGTRVYIGAEDVFIAPGVYTYELRYRTTRQIRHFADFDEVYWNATGNFWSFPIRQAIATVVLPPGAQVLKTALYTGPLGAQRTNARVVSRGEREVTFQTTRALGVGEGLSVAVSFPKGIVPEISATRRLVHAGIDNFGLWLLLAAPALLALYYVRTWRRVGLDPDKGVVIPLFEPPTGISPAAASFIYYRGTGVKMRGASRALVAALMSLAVKGVVRLIEEGRKLALERRNAPREVRDQLSPGERAVEAALLGSRERIVIDKSNASTLRSAVAVFEKAMQREYGKRFFRTNLGWTIFGLVLSGLAIGAAAATFPASDFMIFNTLLAAGASFVGSRLVVQGARRLVGDLPGGSAAFGSVLVVLGAAVLAAAVAGFVLLPWIAPEIATRLGATLAASAAAAAAIVLILLNLAFAALLFAPTPEGRMAGDQLEGFRLYLLVAEAERMNLPGRPDFTTTLYERYLPYAVALGVEKPWSKALDAHIARGMPGEDRRSYQPQFYSGRADFSAGRVASSTAAIASTLGTSFASAMPSQSGSGGGGSSGGGGGGGGGGGW